MDIYRLLATIGKKIFYENYEDIENERYDVIYEKYKGVYCMFVNDVRPTFLVSHQL